jgi:hypothetical protein
LPKSNQFDPGDEFRRIGAVAIQDALLAQFPVERGFDLPNGSASRVVQDA